MTDAILLHQSILVCGDGRCTITASVISVCGVRTGALCLHRSSMCAERRLVKYYLNNHRVARDDLYTICAPVIVGVTTDALSLHVISVCGVMTRKLLHQLPLLTE